MEQNLELIKKQFEDKINNCQSEAELELIRIEALGRNGTLNDLFSKIKDIAPENKKQYGADLNQIKNTIEELIDTKITSGLGPQTKIIKEETAIGQLKKLGHLHPITITERQINALFKSLGFSVYDGPEIETDEFCFQRLNVPSDHPAREMQDSIYIKEPEFLLRTQTSSIEARLLAAQGRANPQTAFKAAFPGTVYRNEKVTKSNHFIFHQYQGVAVDKNITMKDLIGVFNILFKHLYGNDVIVRYRCKYYPEVEPGLGLDLNCFSCHGTGCPVCKGAGWIEMGGAGMIHPKVMKMANLDPKIWRGFAFGLGLDRWVMAKYNIKDIRTLMGGNLAYKPNEL